MKKTQPVGFLIRGLAELSQIHHSRVPDDMRDFVQRFHALSSSMIELRVSAENASRLAQEKRIKTLLDRIAMAKVNRSWRKSHFNTFDVLGVPHSRLESVHSNVIAWLLDPIESHGLGDWFLKEFVRRSHDNTLSVDGPVKVTREAYNEGDRPDIVVDGKTWRLVVEVKCEAMEGRDQSARYLKSSRAANRKTYFIGFVNLGVTRSPKAGKWSTTMISGRF
jgi:hypothetical protein